MKIPKSLFGFGLLILLMTLLWAGCGKKEETSSSGAGPAEGIAPATNQPDSTQSSTSAGGATAAKTVEKVPAPKPLRKITLAEGTEFSVIMLDSLSTKTNQAGNLFKATLAAPIKDGDWIVANQRDPVEGEVVISDQGGRVKGVASIEVTLKRLTLADGRQVPISVNTLAIQARSTKKKDAAKVGIGAGVGAAIGAIAGGGKGAAIGAGVGGGAGTAAVLATKGEPASIKSETKLTFKLTAPLTIQEVRK